MRLRNAQVIGVTLALLVGVAAVAVSWCATPMCAAMMARQAPTDMVACAGPAGPQLSADCAGMRTSTPATAAAAPKTPTAPDLYAVTAGSVAVPAPAAVRVVYRAPIDDPPRLTLDTSRLRI